MAALSFGRPALAASFSGKGLVFVSSLLCSSRRSTLNTSSRTLAASSFGSGSADSAYLSPGSLLLQVSSLGSGFDACILSFLLSPSTSLLPF